MVASYFMNITTTTKKQKNKNKKKLHRIRCNKRRITSL